MNVGGTTIHVTAPSVLGAPSTTIRSPHNNSQLSRTSSNGGTMPQRSPFAIQELLGLGDSTTSHHQMHHHQHRSPTAGISAITPNSAGSTYPTQRVLPPTSCFGSGGDPGAGLHHPHMNLTASRMAYFNAQAAVAAAFLPHNMAAAAASVSGPGSGPGSVLHQPHIRHDGNSGGESQSHALLPACIRFFLLYPI
ncbi:hypothetical protein C0J52_27633 [Blattella germanica]|nr:hypothetical protein C0J52_27633 [Blattella germanica]